MNNNHNQEQPPAGPPPQNNNGPPPMVRPNGQAPRSMEELTAHHNHWDTLAIRDETSRNISSTSTTETTTLVNENCSAVILKKLPEKLGDPVVDYVVDPRVPLILGRPFLRIGRALIDVISEELTLWVDDEAITFKVGQTSKYSCNDAESVNQIDVIDVACEEYVQKVLGFSKIPKSGNPTPTLDPIISSSSLSFTPFKGSGFILEEIETFLQTLDELSNLDDDYYDTMGDILYL
nr:reverse transcriptase domain-containing protein [Tanacetum cinerariifolium]